MWHSGECSKNIKLQHNQYFGYVQLVSQLVTLSSHRCKHRGLTIVLGKQKHFKADLNIITMTSKIDKENFIRILQEF